MQHHQKIHFANEFEGARGRNKFGTCLLEYVCILPDLITEQSLYPDTCGGQNIHHNVAAMFLYVVQNTDLEIVTHNFCENGHSHMECDSMHAVMEQTESITLH